MNHRFDALITASNIVTKLPELVLEKDDGRVITTGKFDVYPNGANVTPDRVVFTIDLRSGEEESIHSVVKKIKSLVSSYQRGQIQISIAQKIFMKPKALSENICHLFKETANIWECPIYPSELVQGMMPWYFLITQRLEGFLSRVKKA